MLGLQHMCTYWNADDFVVANDGQQKDLGVL